MEMEIDIDSQSNNDTSNSNGSRESVELDKNVYAWGNNINGELGHGHVNNNEDHINNPIKLDFKAKITSIACGENHTLFVTTNGLYSSGSNDHGQLGHDHENKNSPQLIDVLEGRDITSVAAGYAHSLAIDKWGTLFAWGSDSHGQLGNGLGRSEDDKLVKRPKVVKHLATKNVVQIQAGQFHSMVLTKAGEIYTFGSNKYGQLGLGFANGSNQVTPCLVESLLGFPTLMICTGGFHSFVLSFSGSVMGWGKNTHGQLGISDNEDKCQPTQLSTLRSLNVRYISAGSEHSAFLTQDGGVFTCGSGAYGQLGHSSLSNEILPRKILEFGSIVTQVASGNRHTLCLTNNKLYIFGLGTGGSKIINLNITGLTTGIHSLYAGGDQSFALEVIVQRKEQVINLNPSNLSCDYRQYNFLNHILTITDEYINEICSAVEPVDQDIMSLVEVLFASPSCWNSSFLLSNGRHVPCTWKNIGVDLHEAEAVLTRLGSLKVPSLKELIDHLIISELLPKLPHQKHTEILRVYILLPLCPNFYDGTNQMLPIFYAERVSSLAPAMQDVIIRWLYNSPNEQIIRLISVYKRTILNILGQKYANDHKLRDKTLKTCLSFIKLINSINKIGLKLSYHTFAIPQLTSKVNIKRDYVNWINKVKSLFYFCDYPFVFDAQAKTIILQTDQYLQMQNAVNTATTQHLTSMMMFPQFRLNTSQEEVQCLLINVSRATIVEDTINNLTNLTTHDLKKPLKVKFIGEEAEDAGGVKKEFFLLLIREILDPKYFMFNYHEDSRLIWFNENSFEDEIMYFLIGLICGLAIYNHTIINLPFPLALYKKLLDEKVDLNDLKDLSPTIAKSFEQLLEYDQDDFEDTFGLNFEISKENFGVLKVVPLKENGSNIAVTKENRTEFVELYVSYILEKSVVKQFNAFKAGFYNVCGSNVITLFHAQELQGMVTGNEDYDWGELERNCAYKGVYSHKHPTIIMFWEVFHSLSLEDKKNFLLFLSGNDRIPILGMKDLKMCIQPTGDERFLPVSHTCYNVLDLPEYQTAERLRYKLLQAIQQTEGFSLV